MEEIRKLRIEIVELKDEIDALKHQLQGTQDWLFRAEAIVECYIKETDDKNGLGGMYFVDKISSY